MFKNPFLVYKLCKKDAIRRNLSDENYNVLPAKLCFEVMGLT